MTEQFRIFTPENRKIPDGRTATGVVEKARVFSAPHGVAPKKCRKNWVGATQPASSPATREKARTKMDETTPIRLFRRHELDIRRRVRALPDRSSIAVFVTRRRDGSEDCLIAPQDELAALFHARSFANHFRRPLRDRWAATIPVVAAIELGTELYAATFMMSLPPTEAKEVN